VQTTISSTKAKDQLQPGAFSSDEVQQIREAIIKKYNAVSTSATGYFRYAVGKKGVDLCKEMAARARINLSLLQVKNVEVLEVASETLPFPDHTFDRVISNGVINLSPDKIGLFAEIYRVLKPGGQLQFADIILEKELTPHLAEGVE